LKTFRGDPNTLDHPPPRYGLVSNIYIPKYIKINSAQNNIKKIPKNKNILNRLKTTEDAIPKNNSNEISRYTFVKPVSFNYKIF
jgi:hypothetical protein